MADTSKDTKISKKTVSDIKYKKIEPLINDPAIKSFKNEVASLLPKNMSRESVRFRLHNVDTSVGNAIRRTIIDELPVKALIAKTIDTNEPFIIPDEIRDRIAFIPIDQSIPTGTKFSLSVDENGTVYSHHIKSVSFPSSVETDKAKQKDEPNDGKGPRDDKGPKLMDRFHIANLPNGKYLHIPEIVVEEGYGYNKSYFSISSDISYEPEDINFTNVLNEKANIVSRTMLISDLKNSMKETGFSTSDIEKMTYRSRVLIIPNKNNETLLVKEERDKIIKNYDFIIRPTTQIPVRSSFNTSCRNFELRVRTKGNVDIHNLIPAVCDNIIDRITKTMGLPIETETVLAFNNSKNQKQPTKVHKLEIKGETHTIAELLLKHVYEIDPTIAFLRKIPIARGFSQRTITLELIHQDPQQIIKQACNRIIGIFNDIKKAFTFI